VRGDLYDLIGGGHLDLMTAQAVMVQVGPA